MMSAIDPEYLPLKALTCYSGLCVRTLRTYIAHPSRPLPHYKIGGKILVRRGEFDVWASQFRVRDQAGAVDALVNDVLAGLG